MSNEVALNTFPRNRAEALTMLNLQNQDLSEKTPSEIQEMYFKTLRQIQEDYREKRSSDYHW